MFHYFGYGSNLNAVGMRSKGVDAVSSRPAVLRDWRLAFNINHPYAFEGKVANIVPATGSSVHGALYVCRDESLGPLDLFEGLDVYYERRLLNIEPYDGEPTSSYVYVGTQAMQSDEGRPSQRYRKIIFDGGISLGIEHQYLEWIANHETYPSPNCAPFTPPDANPRLFTLQDVIGLSNYTILAGHVFDMSVAGPHQQTLLPMLEKRDVTQFFLQRMYSERGADSIELIERGHQNDEQNVYLNEYLHAFAHEYRYAGRLHSSD
jgi:gamma-glutamylcyclotransferase (GGCT)/AIG2-like uncharacterized protein YtfP